MEINWDSFKVFNLEAKGIHFKFEDLCRQLFINENLSENKRNRYLHANPNNHGLETEPIFNENIKRWIGFQAKYFDDRVDYEQIKHSAEKIIEYYTGQEGVVELVYLFCNRPIKKTAKGYKDTKSILMNAGIELELITNDTILDLVRSKYTYLGLYYFGNHSISSEWFLTHSDVMFAELGERYNQEFNVESIFTDEMSLFVRDNRAAVYLNQKKNNLLKKIEEERYFHYGYQAYLATLAEKVLELEDVDVHTLTNAYGWHEKVKSSIASCIEELENKRNEVQENITELSREPQKGGNGKIRDLYREIDEIEELIEMVDQLSITEREHELLEKRVLLLKGEAGIGKSQLLAWKTKKMLEENRAALLLVSGIYFNNDPIVNQIMNNLHLEYSIDELIDILEALGEKENHIVPIFIDALNETWNRRLWKTGLFSIINKISKSPMVKLVVSYRIEYEHFVLPENVSDQAEQYIAMYHTGFEKNSIPAVKEFLHHYHIPFSPIAHFSREMTNPLFLTLFCKTYNGDEVSLPVLFERVIKQTNKSIYNAFQESFMNKGYSEEDNLLGELINEISILMISKEKRYITKQELIRLDFWAEYGIIPASYIKQLIKEQILYDSTYEEEEYYHLSYDQMNDYYCAKAIFCLFKNREEVREYLSKAVLGIDGKTMEKSWNSGLFIHACAMYAEKYHEECIDIIDAVDDSFEKTQIVNGFIDSFQWRKAQTICVETFMDLLQKYSCQPEVVWPMVISNSMKMNHPLNADFLHDILFRYSLDMRDYAWTLYINNLALDKTDRLVQLIEMYDQGETLEVISEEQIKLLLTLLGWVLTSSNRWIRDYASKAMVEILKGHISLCVPLLVKFKSVNDPYVISRLYGVIFGASCKRTSEDSIKTLAEYIYESVFNQDKVYPDILLRDYARLIIERFMFEEPNYTGVIDYHKIVPPYNSEPIPEIEDQQYLQREWKGGLFRIIHSMCFDGMGMYGDFGRYVFQMALKSFEIDEKKIFNYAIYYILNELKYKEELFGENDRYCSSYDRHDTIKVERIGKKYQWITMYNILARVSDHCQMIDRYNYPPMANVHYEGSWDPYIRDFDPTLNKHFMKCATAPKFIMLDEFIRMGKEENKRTDLSTEENRKKWLEEKGVFFRGLKNILILDDNNGTNWVCLSTHIDTGRKNSDTEKQYVWSGLYAFFITRDQEEMIKSISERGQSIILSEITYPHETYAIFNREYPWSPSCIEFDKNAWIEASFETGEFEDVPIEASIPSAIDLLLRQYRGLYDEEDELGFGVVDTDSDDDVEEDEIDECIVDGEERIQKAENGYRNVPIEKNIGLILHATTKLLWEEEYDATKESSIIYNMPCGNLIKEMNLTQLEADGFYYDDKRELAAFDADFVQGISSVIIRKDILDDYLKKIGLRLVWFVEAGKDIFDSDTKRCRSEWETLFVYNGDSISGELQHFRTS